MIAAIAIILVFIGGLLFFLYNFVIKGMFVETKEYPVPSLLGKTMDDLERDPTILGEFKVEEGDVVFSEEYGEGEICAQSPEADTMAREGNLVIRVNISGGEDKMYMEDVTGWDARKALQLLQNEMGLDVEEEQAFSDTITEGYVISYTPMKGKQVEKGDKVVLVISKGPEIPKVMVPPFVNSKFEDVERQLSSMGLIRGKVDYFPSDEYPEGRVTWQSVPANREVDKGTVIDFWVSSGPEETVPPETEPPATEPPATEPPATQPPPTAEPTPQATQDVGLPSGTEIITVDLDGYEGSVNVRIVVGDRLIFDGTVEASESTRTLKRSVTGSGQQIVYIYINDILEHSYPVDFSRT